MSKDNEARVFDAARLREEIVAKWGPAGAHVEVFDMMVADAARWRYARQYLDTWTINEWRSWLGHQPSEDGNQIADKAIDAALAQQEAK